MKTKFTKFRHLLSAVLLCLICGNVWGQEVYEHTMTKETIWTKKETKKLSGINWKLTTEATYLAYEANHQAQQFGSGKSAVSSATISTDEITGNITSIKVIASASITSGAVISASVNDQAFLCNGQTEVTLKNETPTQTQYEFVGLQKGEIKITLSQTSQKKALYLKAIEITYTVISENQVATPTFTPANGTTFIGNTNIKLSCETAGANIYYTTDGVTEPSATSGTLYTEAGIDIDKTTTIKAIAIKEEMEDSYVATATYTRLEPITLPYSNDFKSNLEGWTIDQKLGTIKWASSTSGATINGFNNNVESWLISPLIKVDNNQNIVLSFASATQYTGPALELYYTTDNETWTNITNQASWATTTTNTPSGDIIATSATGYLRFAFRYQSTTGGTGKAAQWSITDLTIKEEPAKSIIDPLTQAMTLTGPWTAEGLAALDLANITSIDMTAISIPENATLNNNINPNCLIYIKDKVTVPNTWKNVVEMTDDGGIGEITISEGYPFWNTKNIITADVTYTRTYPKAGTSSLCLPFAATVEGGIQAQEFTDAQGTTVYFKDVTELKANTPYLIEVTKGETKTFKGEELPVTETPTVKFGDYTFKGTYSQIDNATGLYIMDNQGTGFAKATDRNNIPAFRAYLEYTGATPQNAPARLTRGFDDGDATNIDNQEIKSALTITSENGILNIVSGKAQTVGLYSINGQLLQNIQLNEGNNEVFGLAKGIYLINNQKAVVK